jgi:DNA-directed RNA polymerase II subunit RPB1
MSLFRELSFDGVEVDLIKNVQFCLLAPEEIKRRSVVHVTTTDTYIGNEAVINGIYDPRMGVTDSTRLCATCEQRSTFCPGHFGHIELAVPVFYYQFMQNYVRKILKCVCVRCAKLLYGLDSPEMAAVLRKSNRLHRWNAVYKLCSKVTMCGQHNSAGCGAKNPEKITRDSIKGFTLEWKAGVLEDDSLRKQLFGAQQVLDLFRRISDDDVEAMGLSAKYSRPEWMICTVLPVPPPSVRPCVHHETGQRQEDDLSYTLGHIIKNNNTVAAKLKKGDKLEHVEGFTMQVQYYVATLVENQIPGIAPPTHKRSGRTLRSITDRLKGKEGRIRGNLMGKRVDFSARSVITPDPNISIDEVGVPLRIAMNLTFPEIATDFNRAWLQELVINARTFTPAPRSFARRAKEDASCAS